ncbi:unnamed protein product, partial [Prorocentrum cordatum]
DLLRWSPPVATEHYKYMMKEAARGARDILFFSAPDLPGTLQLVARGIARAVWRQDAALALKLIETSQHAADALTVDGEVVSLRHAPSFEQWAAGVHRLVRERTAALAAYWTPVFSKKEPHPVMTQMYLDRFLTKASDIDLHCPLTPMFRKVLRRARHSAPGVDGLPYAAWSACDYGAQHLARMFGWLCQGQSLFASASVTLQAFLPKGADDSDLPSGVCSRSPDKIRVLGLRNTDVKILSSVMNRVLEPVVQAVAPASQRGFIRGRNFCYNVLELDVHARLASQHPLAVRRYPVLVGFDYGQAFPSLSQSFLLQLLGSLGLPAEILAFVGWMYLAVEGVVLDGGCYSTIFWIRSGIIQGCGLSGSLCALASSPMLADLERSIEQRQLGICRACADDLGAVLYELASLRILVRVLGVMEKIAGLKIKISKCTLVPLVGRMTETLKTMTQTQLASIASDWSGFAVEGWLLYLGMILGPDATVDMNWRGPLMK